MCNNVNVRRAEQSQLGVRPLCAKQLLQLLDVAPQLRILSPKPFNLHKPCPMVILHWAIYNKLCPAAKSKGTERLLRVTHIWANGGQHERFRVPAKAILQHHREKRIAIGDVRLLVFVEAHLGKNVDDLSECAQ